MTAAEEVVPRVFAEDIPDATERAKTPEGLLAKLAAERSEMLAGAIELHVPIPTWKKQLVGVFSPLTKAERERIDKAGRSRKQNSKLSKDERLRLIALDTIATACRRLEIEGVQVPGDVHASGFTEEFGAYLQGLKQDAETSDIVFVAFGKDDERVGRFYMKYEQWAEDPTPQGLDADPFGIE